ncbi:MAG: succinate dehydrogenase, cytochrome b556 subunit [Gammaproteobacteria bacterium]|nr:succinate dehydrogenase, cytochrome b556 subunit [Gammaproteobacteria bacterium]
MPGSDSRPFFLNLIKIRLPVTGVISIFHRISGVILFLAIPWFIYLFEMSLRGEREFNQVMLDLQQFWVKLFLIILLWSIVHHFYAGLRFLCTDFDLGLSKQQSRLTAWLVILLELVTFVMIMYGICV